MQAHDRREAVPDDFDTRVRLTLYREFTLTAAPPSTQKIAEKLGTPLAEVRAAMERLAIAKAIVLQPESREILMANPLCAVPTPYRVQARGRSYFGSCVWDALGIIAMLQTDAVLDTACACCGETMRIEVAGGHPAPGHGIVHFAVPAIRWWENIVFT